LQTEGERFQSLRSYIDDPGRDKLYHPEFKKRLTGFSKHFLCNRYNNDIPIDYDRAFAADLLTYLPEDLLVKVDRASMAHGLECRSPLLDQEMVTFSCSLPPVWKIRNGKGKHIFREAIKGLFPDGFLNRPKMGFTVPLGEWFKTEPQSSIIERLLTGPIIRNNILDKEELKHILLSHRNGTKNHETLIWNVLMLNSWFEIYGAT
jgi:asparagine synthase (glutamine-hydrolysing)